MTSQEYKGHIIDFRVSNGFDHVSFREGIYHGCYSGAHRFTVKASTDQRLEAGSEDVIRSFVLDSVEEENKKVDEEREKWRDWGSFYWSGSTLWASQTSFAPAIVKDFPLVKLRLGKLKVVSMACSESSSEMNAEGIISAYHDLAFPDLTPKSTANQEAESDDEYFDQDDIYD